MGDGGVAHTLLGAGTFEFPRFFLILPDGKPRRSSTSAGLSGHLSSYLIAYPQYFADTENVNFLGSRK
jgi:hypothetical protein